MSPVEKFMSAPKLYFVLDGMLLLGFVLLVAGVASNEWGLVSVAGQETWFGLWNGCTRTAENVVCFPVSNPSFVIYRALVVTAVVVAAASALFALACTAIPKLRTRLFCILLGSGCFVPYLVAIVLFIGNSSPYRSGAITLGWSLGVAAAGGVLCVLASGVTFLMAVRFPAPPIRVPSKPM